MNQITGRQFNKLIERGFSPQEARKIVYEQQVKKWNIIPWTFTLTEQGKKYSSLSSQERDVIRKDLYKNNNNNG